MRALSAAFVASSMIILRVERTLFSSSFFAALPAISCLFFLAASLNRIARSIFAVRRSSSVSIAWANSSEVDDVVGDIAGDAVENVVAGVEVGEEVRESFVSLSDCFFSYWF